MSIRYFINQIEKYPRVTFEEVYNSKKLRQKYNIEDNKANPYDYGYNFKEVEYKSGKIQLYGWLIENKEATKTMIISHGRGVNRLASLQYLEMFKNIAEELGLIRIEGIGEEDIAYHRHPLAFLMEASDDIAYGMIDFEDGCRLGLIAKALSFAASTLR